MGEPGQGPQLGQAFGGRGRLVFAVSPVTPVDPSAVLVEDTAGFESRPVPSRAFRTPRVATLLSVGSSGHVVAAARGRASCCWGGPRPPVCRPAEPA